MKIKISLFFLCTLLTTQIHPACQFDEDYLNDPDNDQKTTRVSPVARTMSTVAAPATPLAACPDIIEHMFEIEPDPSCNTPKFPHIPSNSSFNNSSIGILSPIQRASSTRTPSTPIKTTPSRVEGKDGATTPLACLTIYESSLQGNPKHDNFNRSFRRQNYDN